MEELTDFRKYRGLIIPDADLIGIIQKYCDDSTLPDGCQIAAVSYDNMRQAFIAKLCHKDFQVVEPGCIMMLIRIHETEQYSSCGE